jgi:predicted nucleic acid-binding protein
MVASVLVDTSFLVALIDRRDPNHDWASTLTLRQPPPWQTCEAVLSEAFHLLGPQNARPLIRLLRDNALVATGIADDCLVRMTEILPNSILLTSDSDFRIYRRLGRRTVPTLMPHHRD